MKKPIIAVLLMSGIFASSKIFGASDGYIGRSSDKRGMLQSEYNNAIDVARQKGYERLYLKLIKFPKEKTKITYKEGIKYMWPLLVYAIEQGDVELVELTMQALHITPNTLKPYGERKTTPYLMAEHHNQYAVMDAIKYMMHGNPVSAKDLETLTPRQRQFLLHEYTAD